MLFLREYRRMNIMYYNNCYPPLPKYVLRSRRHNYTLSIKTDNEDRNFITRLLYNDTY